MAKQKSVQRKIPKDGYIAPSNLANVLQNINQQPPTLPDPQVAPVPSAAVRPVANPPAPGTAQPPQPLVP